MPDRVSRGSRALSKPDCFGLAISPKSQASTPRWKMEECMTNDELIRHPLVRL
jgi:hypothetical protein